MSSEKQDFKPVKVKIKSSKQKNTKYISGDLLYSGVNLFGKLSEIYLEKIKNGEMFTGFTTDFNQKEAPKQNDYPTPSLEKSKSTMSVSSSSSQVNTQSVLQSSKVFHMDQEIMSLFRKLQKKDAITKVKALKALQSYIETVGSTFVDEDNYAEQGSELAQALTFFLYHFERIITYEVEKSVRESAHDVLRAFLDTCRKNFSEHIINLFPLWYISFYDSAAEIRQKARNNFLSTFKTPEKRSNLFRTSVENLGSLKANTGITISQNFLYFIQEKISHFETLLSEDMTVLDKPQRDAIYDRIIAGWFDSLSDSFDTFATCKESQNEKSWTAENTKQYIEQLIDVFTLDSDETFPVIFKFLGAKYNPPVRSAALRLFEKLCNYMITFDVSNKELFDKHIHKLANALFSSVADISSQVQKVLWKSVLFYSMNQFGASIWSQIDIKKGFLPQLHTWLKNAAFGAHSDLYKNFVLIVSLMPLFTFEEHFETHCKLEQPAKQSKKPVKEAEETKEEPQSKGKKKGKKKDKNDQAPSAEAPAEKFIKNTFSISEKINVMFEIMKSLFSGIEVEEAVAFNDEIISSYYDTMCFLYLKRILPAIETFTTKGDSKNLASLSKKATQWFMFPVTEFLKKNDPKLQRSLYGQIPEKFIKALELLADKGVNQSQMENLFEDIKETLMIGIERSPQNTIKLLSVFLKNSSSENAFYSKIQEIGSYVIQTLYTILLEGVSNLSKDTIEKFEKDVEVFSYISHNLLTIDLSSGIFELSDKELAKGSPELIEFSILMSILKMVKMVGSKLKPEILLSLEVIQEKFWLCLILRLNYLCRRDSGKILPFMEGPMLSLIFEDIKSYGITDDRYLRFVTQYISPSDCLALLISENIERKPDPRKFKKQVLGDRNKQLDDLFAPYENTIRASLPIQDRCLKVLYIDMLDEYSKSHQILTIYSIFQRKIEDYVLCKQAAWDRTMFSDDTVESFLNSTLEFLQDTEQAHRSLQLAELSSVLSRLIMTTKKTDDNYLIWEDICKVFFKILVDIQQNLTSAVELWKFIAKLLTNEHINENNHFLHFVEGILKSRISRLIKLSNYQEHEFNNEILVLKNFVSAIPRKEILVIESLSRIVLHEENFSMLSQNCLILKLFQQTFLTGGLGFNIDDLAFQKDALGTHYKYIWLMCELLTSNYMPSLAGYTHLRTHLQVFCESEVLPLLLRDCCSNSPNTLFLSAISYLTQKAVHKSSLYAKTLAVIIRMIVCDQSEEPDVSRNQDLSLPEGLNELVAGFNQWRTMMDLTVSDSVEVVLAAEDLRDPEIRRRIEMIKIVLGSVKKLLYSLECYQEILHKIVSRFDVSKESNVILYATMVDDNKLDSKMLQLMEEEKDQIDITDEYLELKTLHKILVHVSGLLDQKFSDVSTMDSILESLNSALKRLGIANTLEIFEITYDKLRIFLKNALEFVIFEESIHEESTEEPEKKKNSILLNTIGINLLQFIKKSIGYLHQNDPSSTNSIIDSIFEYSRIKAEAFNSKMDLLKHRIKETQSLTSKSKKKEGASKHFEDIQDTSKQIQELEFEVINCIGDVIGNIAPYVHEGLEEDMLYSLIGTHIETIQKAAYLILNQFYQSYVPPIKYKYEEEKELNEDELKEQLQKELVDFDKEDTQDEPQEETKGEELDTATEVTEFEQQKVQILKQKRIKGEPDKNVSVMLLEIIEKAPEFREDANQQEHEDADESEDEIVQEGYMNIQSASTLLDDKVMNNDVYSYLLAWNAMLNKIGHAKMRLKFEQDHDYLRVINSLQEFLTMNQQVYEMFLIIIVAFLPSKLNQKWSSSSIIDCKPEWVDLNDQGLIEEFAVYSMYNFMTNFPSLAREYYQDWDKRIYNIVHPIISKLISPAIMENEIRKIEISQVDLNTQNLTFTLFKSTKEILADYKQGEVEVQLRLKIPSEYPLKSIDVKCTKQIQIPEARLRRWLLSIRKMISSQNGDFISGILLWKSNIEKEVEGVEDCLICYSTVHVIDKSLPRLACKNCKNKFHGHCIKKWFAESQKSKCPMCQSYFW